MQLILDMRQTARTNKDWGTSDKIRDALKELDIVVRMERKGQLG
jgi:cysteinyl-tRNA synthetase